MPYAIHGACVAPSIPPSGTEPPLHAHYIRCIASNTRVNPHGYPKTQDTQRTTLSSVRECVYYQLAACIFFATGLPMGIYLTISVAVSIILLWMVLKKINKS